MRSLLLKPELYLQTLLGNKTMTRRGHNLDVVNKNPSLYRMHNIDEGFDNYYRVMFAIPVAETGKIVTVKSKYKKGEVLFLAEPHWVMVDDKHYSPIVAYYSYDVGVEEKMKSSNGLFKKKSKMFMKAVYAREFIKITNIRIERLCDITESDAVSEGIEYYICEQSSRRRYKDYLADASGYGDPKLDYPTVGVAVTSFQTLFSSINGYEPWENNIWVWVYEYEYLKDRSKTIY